MNNKIKKTIIWTSVFSPLLFLFFLMFLGITGFFGPLPSFEELENPKNKQATEIYSSDSVLLGKYYFENRNDVYFDQIPDHLIEALICIEDIRFYSHAGIDFKSLLRAVFGVLTRKSSSGGGSTITQQLAKMLFTDNPGSGLERVMQKIKEWIIAVRLEKHYTKQEILTMYLNKFDFINNAVGINSAAQVYFSKKTEELNLLESAVLVGMCKNPSKYNPNRFLENATKRRNLVLYQMKKYKYLSNENYEFLKNEPIKLIFNLINHNKGPAPYFREQLRKYMNDWCAKNEKPDGKEYNLYSDGLKIYTTIDYQLQIRAEKALKEHLSYLQDIFYDHWKGYTKAPFPKDFEQEQIDNIYNQSIKRTERYRKMKNRNVSKDSIDYFFHKKTKMKIFSWQGEIDTVMTPMDSIIYYKYFIHGGLMSTDPKTGKIKAYVGGINHRYFKYDHVIEGARQVGSTFKPILYTLAIQEGLEPCHKVSNSKVLFEKERWGLPKDWAPKNSDNKYAGLDLTLKFGLANSINKITAYIMKQYGPQAVVDLAKRMGIERKILAVPSLCLGTFDLSVYEMVGAYSVFANEGIWNKPFYIEKICNKDNIVLANFKTEKREVFSKETAEIMVKMLQGVVSGVYCDDCEIVDKNTGEVKRGVKRGTGVRLKYKYEFKNNIGGKTGTTQNNSDGWFVGITPSLVTGVWTGCEERSIHFRDTYYGQGANTALPIWALFMKSVYTDSLSTGYKPVNFKTSEQTSRKFKCVDEIKKQNNNNTNKHNSDPEW